MKWAQIYLWLAIKASTAVDNSNVPLVLKEDNLSALSTCQEASVVATGQSLVYGRIFLGFRRQILKLIVQCFQLFDLNWVTFNWKLQVSSNLYNNFIS